jgi:hypothetical protein
MSATSFYYPSALLSQMYWRPFCKTLSCFVFSPRLSLHRYGTLLACQKVVDCFATSAVKESPVQEIR